MALYLSPIANDQQMDANGDPLVGGKIFTYLAGSTTQAATYTSITGGTPQGNPIILNSLGIPLSPIWLTGGVSYKFVITDSDEVVLRTVDGITGINDVSSTAQEWNESGLVPTYISATQFSVAGDQTSLLQVNRRLRCDVTAGFAYGRISVSTFAAGITTVTVVNDSTPLDSGLSSIAYGFLSYSPSSVPYALYAEAGANATITSLSSLITLPYIPTRQTVLSGPIDTSGLPSFGGSTGSTTVTASGTLIATASNGFASIGTIDRVGSITNPSWTSLSTNGTMYLYLEIAANGTCTTGSTTLAPTYRWGGADVTTNNQFTFSIQEMVGKVGNGATAVQTYRVFVGQVTVSGGVVTAITWYAIQGRYDSGYTSTLPSTGTAISRNSNLGVDIGVSVKAELQCLTAEFGYAIGDIITEIHTTSNASYVSPLTIKRTKTTVGFTVGSSAGIGAQNSTTGTATVLTAANWAYKLTAMRTW